MSNNTGFIEFQVGDILLDQSRGFAGHTRIVKKVDPIKQRIQISHFTKAGTGTQTWENYTRFSTNKYMKNIQKTIGERLQNIHIRKYKSNQWNNSNNQQTNKGTKKSYERNSTKFDLLRWIGPTIARHRDGEMKSIVGELFSLIEMIHAHVNKGLRTPYGKTQAVCAFIRRQCFDSNKKISTMSIEDIMQANLLICSSYVIMLWKYVLEQFYVTDEMLLNPEQYGIDSKQLSRDTTMDEVALPIDAYECLPADILEFSKRYPAFWLTEQFTTHKIEHHKLQPMVKKNTYRPFFAKTNKNKNRSKQAMNQISNNNYPLNSSRSSSITNNITISNNWSRNNVNKASVASNTTQSDINLM